MQSTRVDKYQYDIHQDVVHGAPRELTFMTLFDRQRNMLCALAFMPDDQPLEKPAETVSGYVAIQMHQRSFTTVLDMLRNEKPVYFSWWRDAGSVRLSTSKEPVGEQELRKLFSILYV